MILTLGGSSGFTTEDVSPEAYHDALSVVTFAPDSVQPLLLAEVHLFSYLACLLALFRGMPVSEWGYRFSVTSEGYPSSGSIDAAVSALLQRGLINVDDAGYVGPNEERAKGEIAALFDGASWVQRRSLLQLATDCALALPIGTIKFAFTQLPAVRSAGTMGQLAALDDEDDVQVLHSEFDKITELLGPSAKDMLAPAVAWLSARMLRWE